MSRAPLVHVDQPLGEAGARDLIALPTAQRHHLTTVLRLGEGDRVEVTDGAGGLAVAELTGEGLRLREAPTTTPPPRPPVRVAQALPKGRKLDDVVRMLVELGVDEIVPVEAGRSVRRPEATRAARAVERWQAVARAAGEQARRIHRTRIRPVTEVARLEVEGLWLLAHPAATRALPEELARTDRGRVVAAGTPVTVAVGPEGGWSDGEAEQLTAAGACPVRLGPTVLRTEHAAAAAVAVVSAWLGRWDERPATL